MKKLVCSLLAGILMLGALAACGGSSSSAPAGGSTAGEGGSASAPADMGDREKVTFWHDNASAEALVYDAAAQAYNESQDKYYVEVLNVTDKQKIIVAMSNDEAPDVIKSSNSYVIQYMLNGLLENLQPMVDADSYDLGLFSEKSIEGNSNADGDVYGIPITAITVQLYYNKDLLKDLGYDEPPTTMEELYRIGVEGTVMNEDGSFEVIGYPVLPYPAARQELIYAYGGHWWNPEDRTTLTPQAPGNLASLEANIAYRELFGGRAINDFIAESNTARYSEQDPFFIGKQLFRIDGAWLPTMIEEKGSDVNWGVALMPGTEADPGLLGISRFETDAVIMPAMAQNKEGAWDFIKWMGTDGARIIDLGTGNMPALKSLYDDPEILAIPGAELFIEALKLEKGIQYPLLANFTEYNNMVQAHLEDIYAGDMTPEEGLAELAKNSAGLG